MASVAHPPVVVAAMFPRPGTLHRFAAACVWLATTGMAMAAPAASNWSLLPQAADARPARSGLVKIADGTPVAVRGEDREQVQLIADRFVQLVASTRGLRLQPVTTTDTHPAITFEVDPHARVAGDSGYRIDIDAQGIRVIARAPAGAFYGGVTLWQLLTPPGWTRGTAAEIPAGVIDDHPRFAWRALLLDSGRHFQSVADIEALIDWMSLDKLNVLLWHLTEDQGWRLEIPKYPALTTIGACRAAVGLDAELTGATDKPYCGFYSEAEVRDVVRYAAARFVTVVPEIDLPGHSQAAVAAYPWLGVTGKRPPVWTDWGVSPWLLKPDKKSLQFVEDVLDEVMRLFPSRYISIGGDEADKQQWNAAPELRAQMQRLGLTDMDQLQGWFTGRIADYLVKHGRTPVAWDDQVVSGVALPAAEVVMSWHSSNGGEVARKAASQGHDVVMAPENSLYFDHYQSDLPDEGPGQPPTVTLRQAYDTAVIPNGATAAEAVHVIGVQGNLWTELMPSFAVLQHALFPRAAALSELGWSQEKARDWNGFVERLGAELARYRALGIDYADSAFAPAFEVTDAGRGLLRVALSNQAGAGAIRYTTDEFPLTANSAQYLQPLQFATQGSVSLRAATFARAGLELAAARTQVLDAGTLLSRAGDELDLCSGEPGMRVAGARQPDGTTPVYKIDAGNMCWMWHRVPLGGIGHVTLTVARVTWRFGDEAQGAVVRPRSSAQGEIEIHADACTGPVLARLPLPATQGQNQISATVARALSETPDLCFLATGDPREGQWALARVAFSS